MKTFEEVIKQLKKELYDKEFSKEEYLAGTSSWTLIRERDIGKDNIRLYGFFGWDTGDFINSYMKYAININYEIRYIIEEEEEAKEGFEKIVDEFNEKIKEVNRRKKSELIMDGPFEVEVSVKKRREQKLLRKYLFADKEVGECAICGQNYPIRFLVAAHVKKRAEANEKEKKDAQIVIPMCKFGCDDLFENGYISVKNGFVFRVTITGQELTDAVEKYIQKIVGRKCSYYNKHTKKYFDWHLKYHSE